MSSVSRKSLVKATVGQTIPVRKVMPMTGTKLESQANWSIGDNMAQVDGHAPRHYLVADSTKHTSQKDDDSGSNTHLVRPDEKAGVLQPALGSFECANDFYLDEPIAGEQVDLFDFSRRTLNRVFI